MKPMSGVTAALRGNSPDIRQNRLYVDNKPAVEFSKGLAYIAKRDPLAHTGWQGKIVAEADVEEQRTAWIAELSRENLRVYVGRHMHKEDDLIVRGEETVLDKLDLLMQEKSGETKSNGASDETRKRKRQGKGWTTVRVLTEEGPGAYGAIAHTLHHCRTLLDSDKPFDIILTQDEGMELLRASKIEPMMMFFNPDAPRPYVCFKKYMYFRKPRPLFVDYQFLDLLRKLQNSVQADGLPSKAVCETALLDSVFAQLVDREAQGDVFSRLAT